MLLLLSFEHLPAQLVPLPEKPGGQQPGRQPPVNVMVCRSLMMFQISDSPMMHGRACFTSGPGPARTPPTAPLVGQEAVGRGPKRPTPPSTTPHTVAQINKLWPAPVVACPQHSQPPIPLPRVSDERLPYFLGDHRDTTSRLRLCPTTPTAPSARPGPNCPPWRPKKTTCSPRTPRATSCPSPSRPWSSIRRWVSRMKEARGVPAFFLSRTMAVRDETNPRDVTVNGREQVLRSPPDQSPCPRGFGVYCLMAFVVPVTVPRTSHHNRMGRSVLPWFCLWLSWHPALSIHTHPAPPFTCLCCSLPPFPSTLPCKNQRYHTHSTPNSTSSAHTRHELPSLLELRHTEPSDRVQRHNGSGQEGHLSGPRSAARPGEGRCIHGGRRRNRHLWQGP